MVDENNYLLYKLITERDIKYSLNELLKAL